MTGKSGSSGNAVAPQGAAASLLNGLGVLEAFSIERPVLGVTEIAQRVNLHKSTVSRILTGLAEAGYVQRDEGTGRFRLGLSVITLSGPLLADLDVRRAALPHLEELTETTGETSALAVWNGQHAVVVEQVPSPHQIKHTASIGTRYNKFSSSTVRIFLAALSPEKLSDLLESGQVMGNTGDVSPNDYRDHLAQLNRQDYAVNDGWTLDEEFGVSAPVRDFRGGVVGCITASAPRARVQKLSSSAQLILAVRTAAEAVSARLGYSKAILGAEGTG